MSLARATYRFAASACADLVVAVRCSSRPSCVSAAAVWHCAVRGRFYRSVAGRYADRLRQSGSPFRRVMIGDVPLIVDVTEFTTSALYFGNIPYEPETTSYLGSVFGPGASSLTSARTMAISRSWLLLSSGSGVVSLRSSPIRRFSGSSRSTFA